MRNDAPTQIRPATIGTAFHDARALAESGRCIWCETAPAAPSSYLCTDCSRSDPDGVLAARS